VLAFVCVSDVKMVFIACECRIVTAFMRMRKRVCIFVRFGASRKGPLVFAALSDMTVKARRRESMGE